MGEAKRRQTGGAPAPKRQSNRSLVFAGLAVVVIAVIAALYYLTLPPEPDSEALPQVSEDKPPFPAELDRFGVSVGPADAPVVVREFADYQCPGCARFAEASQRLKTEYVDTGKVRFVYFDFPLRQHANAVPAAMAARCAGDQGQYWSMQERLFAEQDAWAGLASPGERFSDYADDLGLDVRRFDRCLESELHREAIEASLQVARQLKVSSTPTVLVNNIPLTRPGWAQLSAVVERELAPGN